MVCLRPCTRASSASSASSPLGSWRRSPATMPVAYAITYIFGTVGSAVVIALLGPMLLGIDLEEACRKYEEKHGGKKAVGGPGTAWHQFELRAYRVRQDARIAGMTAEEAERLIPER